MNFFEMEVAERDRQTLVHEHFEYELDDDVAADVAAAGDRFTLGIRPEDVEAVSSDARNAVPAEVEVTEPLGDVTYVYLNIGDQQYTATLEGDIAGGRPDHPRDVPAGEDPPLRRRHGRSRQEPDAAGGRRLRSLTGVETGTGAEVAE